MRGDVLIFGIGVAALALFASRGARAAPAAPWPGYQSDQGAPVFVDEWGEPYVIEPEPEPVPFSDPATPAPWSFPAPDYFDWGGGVAPEDLPAVNPDQNIAAFLAMIRAAEGTEGQPDPYRVLFGYVGLLDSFADHPAELGWPGVPLTDEQCRGAGFGPGCVSTAAGAYQILIKTWRPLKRRLGLPDFSPASQDLAAIALIREAGALNDVRAGNFDMAVAKVRRVWASLPGAGYAGQGTRSLAFVRSVYESAGGSYG